MLEHLHEAMEGKSTPYIPLKSESKPSEGKQDCNKCDLYGECDHQGAYKINGMWCYESIREEYHDKLYRLR